MSTISQQELYEALIADVRVRAAQGGAAVDVAAALVALASVEAARGLLGGMKIESQGDYVDGIAHAHGLWQVNDRAHKVDLGSIPLLSYQIGLALGVFAEASAFVKKAASAIEQRRQKGEAINYQPARDLPHFYNVAWQYGVGGLQTWTSATTDATVEGFEAFRASIGKPVTSEYRKRAASFRSTYDFFIADPPTVWRDVVVAGATHPIASIGETATIAKEAAVEHLPELPDLPSIPKIPGPGEFAANIAGALWEVGKTFLLVFVVCALAGVLLLFYLIRSSNRAAASIRSVEVSTPGGGRASVRKGA